MKRSDLVDALKKAESALSAKELVPSFPNFFFDGKRVQAFDGIVAIQTACSAAITGGMRGRLLMDFLSASRAPEVEFTPSDNKCLIKAGRAKLEMPLDPLSDFTHVWPDDAAPTLEFSEAMLAAVKACSVTMGLDPSSPVLLGITIEVAADQLILYSATNLSMTSCVVKANAPKSLAGKALVLPIRFCELLLSRSKPKTLAITPKWVEARYSDGTRIHAASIGDADPKVFRKVLDKIEWQNFVKVPKGIDGCLARAQVVLGSDDTQHSAVIVKDDRLRFNTLGPVGEATDYVKIEQHPGIEVRVRPSLLLKPLEHAQTLRILPNCFAFAGPNYHSLVSVATA